MSYNSLLQLRKHQSFQESRMAKYSSFLFHQMQFFLYGQSHFDIETKKLQFIDQILDFFLYPFKICNKHFFIEIFIRSR